MSLPPSLVALMAPRPVERIDGQRVVRLRSLTRPELAPMAIALAEIIASLDMAQAIRPANRTEGIIRDEAQARLEALLADRREADELVAAMREVLGS